LAGQKSQLASLFTAGFILLTVLFLAALFTNLPEAVLGAVVIDAAIGLVKVPVLRRAKNTSRLDLGKTGTLGAIGREHVYTTVREAVTAMRKSPDGALTSIALAV